MANPLSNEKELYERIQKEKLTISPLVWQLLDHHIRNDVYAISLIVGSHITGEDKEPIPPEHGEKILNHCEEIKAFLKKLREATKIPISETN